MTDFTFRSFEGLEACQLRAKEDGDGLTVEGLVVPYGVAIDAVDLTPNGVLRYTEEWAPGSNARAVRAPNRVPLTYNHDESLPARLGAGSVFRETPEGLWGSFRLDRSTSDKAIEALTSSHVNLSVGFLSLFPKAGSEKPGSHVLRKAVWLRHVAAVPEGQYAEARIVAFREADVAAAAAALAEDPTENELEAKRQAEQALELVSWIESESTRQAAWDAWAAGTGEKPA